MKQVLLESLHEAGIILLNSFGAISNYTIKENQSNIITQADIESEKKIISMMKARF